VCAGVYVGHGILATYIANCFGFGGEVWGLQLVQRLARELLILTVVSIYIRQVSVRFGDPVSLDKNYRLHICISSGDKQFGIVLFVLTLSKQCTPRSTEIGGGLVRLMDTTAVHQVYSANGMLIVMHPSHYCSKECQAGPIAVNIPVGLLISIRG
jgi:hypothetical protein